MTDRNAVDGLADALKDLLNPLARAAQDDEDFALFLSQMGWTAPTVDLDEVAAAVSAAQAAFGGLAKNPTFDTLEGLEKTLRSLRGTATAVANLGKAVASAAGEPSGDAVVLRELGADLFDHLILIYVARKSPAIYSALSTLGIIDRRVANPIATAGAPSLLARTKVERHVLALDALAPLLTDPVTHLRSRLGVRSLNAAADAEAMLGSLYGQLRELVVFSGGQGVLGSDLDSIPADDRNRRSGAFSLPLPTAEDDQDAPTTWLSLVVTLDPAGVTTPAGDQGPGTTLEPEDGVTAGISLPGAHLDLELTAGIATIFLPQRPEPSPPVVHGGTGAGVHVRAAFATVRPLGTPAFVVGANSLGLTVGGVHAAVDGRFGRAADPRLDLDISVAADHARFRLAPTEGDGFLATVLPADGIGFDFDLGIGWSTRRGLYFSGAAGLEAEFPVHVSLLGVLTIDAVHLKLHADAAGLTVAVAATAGLKLGPIAATVERMGLQAKAIATRGGGNVGPFDVTPAFLPPRGAGLAIDASVVSGGGYILNDYEHGRYAGILQLKIGDFVTVTAIGLIATKMPDGSRGFSLLVILTATFPPIQLGFGFTLAGLGGILGVNRTMNLPALRDGARTGLLESILFPVDPVARATKVISDVESVFPVARDRFVIGLQARLGWGSPRLVTADLGIIIEVPLPVRIALIGKISIVLPTEKAAVVELHLDVVGTVDTGRGELSIDARLHDSKVAVFTVFGDMAVRVGWGANPTFVVSIGGFNPRFTPPPDFPALQRLTIALATSENPSVRLETYLALTANTIQVGARVLAHAELDAGVLGLFSADAYLGFDALVTLVPFSFIVDLGGGIVIAHNGAPFIGAEVLLTLYGPQPVRAVGYAEVHFLGTHRIPFDVTVGPPAPEATLAAVDPIGALLTALGRLESWSALPPRNDVGLALREVAADTILAHPLGLLAVRERVVPLDVRIERFGGAPIDGGPRSYSLSYRIGADATVPQGTTVRDAWAPGDLFDLQDDEKLSRPAFDQLPSGHTGIAAPQAAGGAVRLGAEPGYETRVVDTIEKLSVPHAPYALPEIVAAMLKDLAASRAAAGYTGPDRAVRVAAPRYRVASTEDLTPVGGTHLSWVEAHAARGYPHTAGPARGLQVVGAHEVPQ